MEFRGLALRLEFSTEGKDDKRFGNYTTAVQQINMQLKDLTYSPCKKQGDICRSLSRIW